MKKIMCLSLVFMLLFSFCGCVDVSYDSSINEEGVQSQKVIDTESKEKGNITLGQKNAVRKAKSYLKVSPFSKEGLINQLEFEGFSNEDATYGVENCAADWNEQAAKKAESYLDLMAFSKDGLINQLEFEGFTSEEALYGAEAVGY